MLGCLERMNILFQAYHYFLLLSHYLIIIFFLSHIISVFMNIRYVSISDGHDNVCTCVVATPHISGGLQWLHVFALSLLLYKFGRTLSFCIRWSWLISFLESFRFLFLWMTISAYNFFRPTFHPLYLRWNWSLIFWILYRPYL